MSSLGKYIIRAKLEVNGVVEKPDVVGAIFGQTEGIFGPELDLNELLKSGRIGRIEIKLEEKGKGMVGTLVIPSNLSKSMTSLLAATVESVDKIGPYTCKVTVERIIDSREEKRKAIIDRAREILQEWSKETRPEVEELIKEFVESLRVPEVMQYGPEKLPAGPCIDSSESIIIVEGRADVINLLKNGYDNVIALGGAKIPDTIVRLSKEKEVTLFLDGDRSADLMLRSIPKFVSVDFVARAPQGKEVEELTAKEVAKALRERVPAVKLMARERAQVERVKAKSVVKEIAETVGELKGTLEAVVFDDKLNRLKKMPVSKLVNALNEMEAAYAVVFDGIATNRLIDIAVRKGVKLIVAERISPSVRQANIELLTFKDVS